jgi:hypothetical protein
MPNLINIFVPIETLLSDIRSLIQDNGMRLYMETIKEETSTIVEIEKIENLDEKINEHYHAFYFTSEIFMENVHESFFDDDFCVHAIEVLGGRSDAANIENLSLRIISKTPDKTVKSFMDKLNKHLKNKEEYGMGVEPVTSEFHRKVFYHKNAIKSKTLWFDFKRKVTATTVSAF